MTYRTREDGGIDRGYVSGYFADDGMWIPGKWMVVDSDEWKAAGGYFESLEKPRLDWLLLAVLILDLGVWVGLLAWWIWR